MHANPFTGPRIAECATCGAAFEVPPGEMLDTDRTDFGRFMEELERSED